MVMLSLDNWFVFSLEVEWMFRAGTVVCLVLNNRLKFL